MPDFQGKVALVTGVGRVGQIGHAVARGLGRGGAKLLLADVNAVGLADRVKEFAAEGIAAKASAGDLTQPEAGRAAVAAAQAQFGGLDIVVNVAGGFFSYGPFTEIKPETLDKDLAINFKTAFFVCQAAVPALLKRGGGSIVSFASIAVVRSLMHMAAYSASKSAVAGMTRALAREYRDAGLRVNAVAPATVRTADNVASMQPDAKTPLVEIDQVVQTVLFLASDAASAITGQVVPITGKAY
ncbi:MAG TPA: SDR family NAD(P)-dependent oxidoreductase [Gemmatimonadales bacterium]|jgi:NAD(P)-dependent dehydrogenase (short-subunit alcohol dehydrogenase family)|nr:SDR family NAD(P)-dependent oxidoreductase [Gemmatimonadales bacterium]